MEPRLGIIGCGAIGSVLVRAVAERVVSARLVALMDIAPGKCEGLARLVAGSGLGEPRVTSSLDDLLAEEPRVVVEAASQEAVRLYGPRVLEAGADLVVLSVGALLDEELLRRLEEASRRGGGRVYAPTGAIAGLDAIRALRTGGARLEKVLLRTRKPASSLGVVVEEPTVLYRGPAREAVKRYPFNVNVAAALALAAGAEPLVEIVADPGIKRNIHEIIVESDASRLRITVENVPSPVNPRTSLLAAYSCIELLRRLLSPSWLEIGS